MSKDAVLQILVDTGEAMRPGQIVEATGLDKDVVAKAIKELKKEGKIDSPKNCFYAAVK
ncbi:MAG: transcriptional regulator [Coriobacteriales bacterium]|nr:transcriptional regulator [Coriobacteriales bacterium]